MTDEIRAPIFQPDKALDRWVLHCPTCDNPHVVVNDIVLEMGGFELRPEGRLVLKVNGHSDEECRHKFSVVINFSDGGTMAVVDSHPTPYLKSRSES